MSHVSHLPRSRLSLAEYEKKVRESLRWIRVPQSVLGRRSSLGEDARLTLLNAWRGGRSAFAAAARIERAWRESRRHPHRADPMQARFVHPHKVPIHLLVDWGQIACRKRMRRDDSATRNPYEVTCPRCLRVMVRDLGYDLERIKAYQEGRVLDPAHKRARHVLRARRPR